MLDGGTVGIVSNSSTLDSSGQEKGQTFNQESQSILQKKELPKMLEDITNLTVIREQKEKGTLRGTKIIVGNRIEEKSESSSEDGNILNK